MTVVINWRSTRSLQGKTCPETSVVARDSLSEGLDLLNLLREELGESLLEGLDNLVNTLRHGINMSGAPLPESWPSSNGRR